MITFKVKLKIGGKWIEIDNVEYVSIPEIKAPAEEQGVRFGKRVDLRQYNKKKPAQNRVSSPGEQAAERVNQQHEKNTLEALEKGEQQSKITLKGLMEL